jgi:hypothetical protein
LPTGLKPGLLAFAPSFTIPNHEKPDYYFIKYEKS